MIGGTTTRAFRVVWMLEERELAYGHTDAGKTRLAARVGTLIVHAAGQPLIVYAAGQPLIVYAAGQPLISTE